MLEQQKDMDSWDKKDREWFLVGGGFVAAGAVLSGITRSVRWFTLGSLVGALVFIARLTDKKAACGCKLFEKKKVVAAEEQLGAPQIPTEDYRATSEMPRGPVDPRKYPVAHRVPDCEIDMDPMDDRIRPHFTGPLGPENDPVRYW